MKERGNKLLKTIDRFVGPIIVFALGLFRGNVFFRRYSSLRASERGVAIQKTSPFLKGNGCNSNQGDFQKSNKEEEKISLSAKADIPLYKRGYLEKATPRYLLIKTAAIGDTILLSSVIQEIKASQPNSSISLLSAKNNLEAARLLDNVDEIIVFDFASPLFSLKRVMNLPKFDYVLDFAQWDKISAIITAFVKADYKVGFYRENMYRHYAYDNFAEHSDDCHEVDNYRKLCELIGIKCKKFLPRIRPLLSLRDISPNSKALGENLRKYVVFHMFPGGSLQNLKKWSLNKWFELACKINKEFGYSILITGAKADLEEAKAFCEMLRQNNIDFYNATGKLSLTETASVLEKSKMLVTVNTGIMHLASALKVPLVVINGATSVKRWGPLSNNSLAVSANLSCYPCISLGFESKCDSPRCLESISVDSVFDLAKRSLA